MSGQNSRVTDFDEFSFLPDQAAEAGLTVPIPRGERLTLTLPDGRTLSAVRYGGSAPEVTLLHGAGLNAHTWDTTILALGRPALAIDLAGHGDSSWRDDAALGGRPLTRGGVLDYFARSPFYDPACNNELLRARGLGLDSLRCVCACVWGRERKEREGVERAPTQGRMRKRR